MFDKTLSITLSAFNTPTTVTFRIKGFSKNGDMLDVTSNSLSERTDVLLNQQI